MASKKKTVRVARPRPPSIPPELLADVAKMFAEHVRDREAARLQVFREAWESIGREGKGPDVVAQRAALAVAYLGGGAK
jgi:hypothetical protein